MPFEANPKAIISCLEFAVILLDVVSTCFNSRQSAKNRMASQKPDPETGKLPCPLGVRCHCCLLLEGFLVGHGK